jgi:flagella basal body P-ring formation protein FlgA
MFVCFTVVAGAALADPVTLRTRIEANGPAITLGDVFDGAGDIAAREIAPAPPPGQVSTLSMPMLTALASAAGLEFTPPSGVGEVRVVRPGGMRATLPPSSAMTYSRGNGIATPFGANEAIVRRGDAVTVSYQTGGVFISLRTHAMDNGSLGQSVRFANPSSARSPIDAIVTGPGAARASTP